MKAAHTSRIPALLLEFWLFPPLRPNSVHRRRLDLNAYVIGFGGKLSEAIGARRIFRARLAVRGALSPLQSWVTDHRAVVTSRHHRCEAGARDPLDV